jgi:hypothetical protein
MAGSARAATSSTLPLDDPRATCATTPVAAGEVSAFLPGERIGTRFATSSTNWIPSAGCERAVDRRR